MAASTRQNEKNSSLVSFMQNSNLWKVHAEFGKYKLEDQDSYEKYKKNLFFASLFFCFCLFICLFVVLVRLLVCVFLFFNLFVSWFVLL